MASANARKIRIQPCFDLEEFLGFAQETRIARETLEQILNLWEKWSGKLEAVELMYGSRSWLAIWLPEEVESEVDKAWQESPGQGFLANSLAQYLCMASVGELLPQTVELGCAPTPSPDEIPGESLVEIGMGLAGVPGQRTLRRYGILTPYPFQGGCEICSLRQGCPKLGQRQSLPSFTLPGHER